MTKRFLNKCSKSTSQMKIKSLLLFTSSLITYYLLLITCHLWALPDLTISDITFSDNSPSKNQVITISATVRNDSDNYSDQTVLTPATSSYQTWTSSRTVGISSASWIANYFNVPSDMYLGKAEVVIRNTSGATTNYIKAEIRETVIDFGKIEPGAFSIHLLDSSKPLNNPTTYHHWQEFIFDAAPKLTAWTTYWLCIESTCPISVGYGVGVSSVAVDKVGGSNDMGVSWTGVDGVEFAFSKIVEFNNFEVYQCTETVVNFFVDGVMFATSTIQKPLATNETVFVSTTWSATAGLRNISVSVDYPNWINESNEVNNSLSKDINVSSAPRIISFFSQDNALGVNITTAVYVYFSEDMEEISTEDAISVKAIRDNESNTIDLLLTGTVEYISSEKKLVFNPGSWKNNYIYKVYISTLAKDIYGNTLNSDEVWQFTTIMAKVEQNVVKESGLYEISISPSALPEDAYIIVSTVTTILSKVQQANAKLVKFDDPYHFFIDNTLRELNAYNASGILLGSNFSSKVTLTIPYSETKGIVNNISPPVREKTLAIYILDEKDNLWVRLPDSAVDTANNTVTATVPHFSVFALMGTSATDLSSAYAYPVPFKLEDKEITFTNLSSVATIKIFTISGELVKEIEHTDGEPCQRWDAKTDEGNILASGIYVYCIENEKEKKFGKLMIIK